MVPDCKVAAFMVEKVQWERIRRRVGKIEASHAPEWLLGLATLAAGVAASSGIAYLALPHATQQPHGATGSVVAAGTRPTLIAACIAGAIVAAALGGLYRREHKKHGGEKSDLQDEMDTIERAWKQQSAEARSEQPDYGDAAWPAPPRKSALF